MTNLLSCSFTFSLFFINTSIHVLGDLHYEECYCPNHSTDSWYTALSCSSEYEQITRDLSKFPDLIDMSWVVKEAVSRFNQRGSHSMCHYVVKANEASFS